MTTKTFSKSLNEWATGLGVADILMDSRPGFLHLLTKAKKGEQVAGHKYISRTQDGFDAKGKPKYKYKWAGDSLKKEHFEDPKVGDLYAGKHNHIEGHYEITGVSGDKVTVKHEESGKSRVMTTKEFASLMRKEHGGKIKKTDARLRREVKEAKGKFKTAREKEAKERGVQVPGAYPPGPEYDNLQEGLHDNDEHIYYNTVEHDVQAEYKAEDGTIVIPYFDPKEKPPGPGWEKKKSGQISWSRELPDGSQQMWYRLPKSIHDAPGESWTLHREGPTYVFRKWIPIRDRDPSNPGAAYLEWDPHRVEDAAGNTVRGEAAYDVARVSSELAREARYLVVVAAVNEKKGKHPRDLSPDKVGPLKFDMSVDEAERVIRGSKSEYIAVFAPDGKQLGRGHGRDHSVAIPDLVSTGDLKDAVLVHNHPGGSSFSGADIALAITHDMAEVRAVTSGGRVHSLKRPEGGWPGTITAALVYHQVGDAFSVAAAEHGAERARLFKEAGLKPTPPKTSQPTHALRMKEEKTGEDSGMFPKFLELTNKILEKVNAGRIEVTRIGSLGKGGSAHADGIGLRARPASGAAEGEAHRPLGSARRGTGEEGVTPFMALLLKASGVAATESAGLFENLLAKASQTYKEEHHGKAPEEGDPANKPSTTKPPSKKMVAAVNRVERMLMSDKPHSETILNWGEASFKSRLQEYAHHEGFSATGGNYRDKLIERVVTLLGAKHGMKGEVKKWFSQGQKDAR